MRPARERPAARASALAALAALAMSAFAPHALAGAQAEEQLAQSVVTVMSRAISDQPVPLNYSARSELRVWLADMSRRLEAKIPDLRAREDFLATVHYEATRAGLDPQLVLGVIQYESAFRKYAISVAGARGYMQVMPFWTRVIGSSEHNLFHLRTNLRYGCVILRHYLDIEGGDIYRALGRYNGSLGQAEYPTGVVGVMSRNWVYTPAAPAMVPASATSVVTPAAVPAPKAVVATPATAGAVVPISTASVLTPAAAAATLVPVSTAPVVQPRK